VNVQTTAASGRPYTATLRPERFGGSGTLGSINGNRLPWRFNVDLRVDKSFALSKEGKKPLNLNVYLRVSNLLNRKNILGVYSSTGSPTDDGYLATAEGRSVTQGIANQGFNLMHTWPLTPGMCATSTTLPSRAVFMWVLHSNSDLFTSDQYTTKTFIN
ncbi:MAG: hypothetical protein ACKOCH_17890, partial [Bacteroidota bacterium]